MQVAAQANPPSPNLKTAMATTDSVSLHCLRCLRFSDAESDAGMGNQVRMAALDCARVRSKCLIRNGFACGFDPIACVDGCAFH